MVIYSTVSFNAFVQHLREGVNRRLDKFERENCQTRNNRSAREWMEFYRKWSKENSVSLNDLVLTYLREEDNAD